MYFKFQAVYGGRLSGRNEEALKVNPVYHDSNQSIHQQVQKDHNGNMNGLRVEMYETFPSKKDKQVHPGILEQQITSANSKIHQPVLLAPVAPDPEPKQADPTLSNIDHNQNINPDAMKSTRETLVADALNNHQHNDDILPNVKKRLPNGNYGMLGYSNEGYVDIETELQVDNANTDNSLKVDPHSLTVCHSTESSPSKSSVSSSDSPTKNGIFLTEAHVHSEAKLESPNHVSDTKSESSEIDPDSLQAKLSDEEKSPINSIETENRTEICKTGVSSNEEVKLNEADREQIDVQDVIITVTEEETPSRQSDSEIHINIDSKTESKLELQTKSSALNTGRLEPESTHRAKGNDSGNLSPRTLKSILLNTSIDKEPSALDNASVNRKSDSEIHETKTVKFSEDTVFIENKSKKYKNERIDRLHLQNMYLGKISNDSAIAKMNPLFNGDSEEHPDSLTDDEKVAHRLSVRKIIGCSDQVYQLTVLC